MPKRISMIFYHLGKLSQIQGPFLSQSQVQSIKSSGISTETYLMLNKTSNSKVPLAIFVLRSDIQI